MTGGDGGLTHNSSISMRGGWRMGVVKGVRTHIEVERQTAAQRETTRTTTQETRRVR